jgi:hypothetical protein
MRWHMLESLATQETGDKRITALEQPRQKSNESPLPKTSQVMVDVTNPSYWKCRGWDVLGQG